MNRYYFNILQALITTEEQAKFENKRLKSQLLKQTHLYILQIVRYLGRCIILLKKFRNLINFI